MEMSEVDNPLVGPPEDPLYTEEDTIWTGTEAHWHCTAQGLKLTEPIEEEHPVIQAYEEEVFEPEAVQVTIKNSQAEPLVVQSQWDGYKLHLDVHSTLEPQMTLWQAAGAASRYYIRHHGGIILTVLLLALLILTGGLLFLLTKSLLPL